MHHARAWGCLLATLLSMMAATNALADSGASLPLAIETARGPVTFSVELADDPDERARGLMFRQTLPPDAGMLFDFGEERPVTMWMRNTPLPLDMLFIRSDGTVARIAERTTPFSERTIASGEPVRYVLELNGGIAGARGVRAGDRVDLPSVR